MSTTPQALAVVVDATDPTPPYEQLRRQLVLLVESGRLAPGQRLPPLRQLARDLGLAVGTVARTYRELELSGLVVSRRGGGTRVAEHPTASGMAEQTLRTAADAFVRAARGAGATRQEAVEAVRGSWG